MWAVEGVSLPDGQACRWVVADGVLGTSGYAPLLPGRYVLAGLVDAHCHLALGSGSGGPVPLDVTAAAGNLTALTATGVTAVRDTGGPPAVTLSLVPADTDPVLLSSGRFLAPAGGYFPAVHEPVRPDELVAAGLAEIQAGARWLKLVGDFALAGAEPELNYDAGTVRALVDAAHLRGVRVAAHTTTSQVGALVAAGVDSVEHGTALDEQVLAALGAAGGAWTPTLCAGAGTVCRRDR